MTQPKMPTSTSLSDSGVPETGTPQHVDMLIAEIMDGGSEAAAVHLLSDLNRAGADGLRERWPTIPESERLFLVQLLAQDAEATIEHNYDRSLLVALDDPLSDTRLAAIEALAELESPAFLNLLLTRVEREDDDRVRAAEVAALGRFALLAELAEIDDDDRSRIHEILMRVLTADPAADVRRRALESVSYLSNDERISEHIQRSFDSGDHDMRISAIYAMGRQSSIEWLETVHDELDSAEPDIRYEAVTAAGMIGSERSVLNVIDLLRDEDPEVRMAAIAALGSIGGRTAINTLRTLAQDDSPVIADAADAALEEAHATDNPFRPIL